MSVYNVHEVFTPTTPAKVTFVDRPEIDEKLRRALLTPGKQIIVYGHSGSGKTTLLANSLRHLKRRSITTRCTSTLTFEQALLNAFDQLNPYYVDSHDLQNSEEVSGALQTDYLGIKAEIESRLTSTSSVEIRRVLPPQLTPQKLAHFLGAAKQCWVLEDFHKIADDEKVKLAQVMKLFMDMASEYISLRIIAIGAVHTAREVIEYEAEMRNRVAEILVPLMTTTELIKIINLGESALNFTINTTVKNQIVNYSNGLAAICHQLCLNLCLAAQITQTLALRRNIFESEIFSHSIEMYMDDASDTLKNVFDKALRQKRKRTYNNGKLILKSLVHFEQSGGTFNQILSQIRRSEPNYPASNLTHYLNELQTEERGRLISYDSNSGLYFFSDPVYRVFALVLLNDRQMFETQDALTGVFFSELLDKTKKLLAETLVITSGVNTPLPPNLR